MRILLSDGSGLTARQVVTRLSALGHEVEAVSSTWWCLTRFTVHVRRIHRVPPFQTDAPGWFKALLDILQKRAIDVLLPTQEQVAWLSADRRQISVPTVLPDFSALSRVQDKIAAFETLTALAIPQPMGCVVRSPTEKREDMAFPVFVKRPISTASSGVRRADDVAGLASAMSELGDDQFLVQEAVPGPVAMVQTVADDGRLVALHANMRLREGAGGAPPSRRAL